MVQEEVGGAFDGAVGRGFCCGRGGGIGFKGRREEPWEGEGVAWAWPLLWVCSLEVIDFEGLWEGLQKVLRACVGVVSVVGVVEGGSQGFRESGRSRRRVM